ncbi:MAG: glycosyltransferase [Phycisphaerales bacterium]|nr:glycosyltransferase [Phycisphaerales bacterium]
MAPARVTHLIPDTQRGGAERMLTRLATLAGARGSSQHHVIVLRHGGDFSDTLREAGVPVTHLGLDGLPGPFFVRRLARAIQSTQPDVVQAWMYHANMLASIAAKAAGDPPVVWNIRCTYQPHLHPRLTRLVIRTNAVLSTWPAAIINNSAMSMAMHEQAGITNDVLEVIPNGIDLNSVPELKRPPSSDRFCFGRHGRWIPKKGNAQLIAAFAQINEDETDAGLRLCGRDVPEGCSQYVSACGLDDSHVQLEPEQTDIYRWLQHLDCFVSPSIDEGFPNALLEAMAAGLPCITTDAGDSRTCLGDDTWVVSCDDVDALAEAMRRMIALDHDARITLGEANRERVRQRFGINSVLDQYESLWRRVAADT